MKKQEISLILSGVALVGGLGAGAWILSVMSATTAKGLLLAALLALPVAFTIGWRLGSRDARAFVSGIERGSGAVIHASSKVADLRAAKIAQARKAQAAPDVRLPPTTRIEMVDVTKEEVIEL